MFAAAFSSLDFTGALKRYQELFERVTEEAIDGEDFEVEEYQPEGESDVIEMLNAARRAGVIQ